MQELTQAELKRQLHYCPETGIFTRLIRSAQCVRIGDIAGSDQNTIKGKSYRHISLNGNKFLAHRLATLYMTGSFPVDYTDHINGNGLDNRWVNLRSVSVRDNSVNMRLISTNTSGHVGVHFIKETNKWQGRIDFNGKTYHLGTFVDKICAIKARKAAEEKYGYHPNHGQVRPL